MSKFGLLKYQSHSGPHHPDCKCNEKMDEETWIIEIVKGDSTFHKETRYNKIRTTKFSMFNFFIKFTFLSFRRFGNLFFLFIALIQLIDPKISPLFRWISIFPLLFYLLINWIKQLYLDGIRRQEDSKINSLTTRKGKLHRGDMKEGVEWKDLAIGDVIKLKKDEVCPADIIILGTSLNKNKEEICYVETERVNGIIGYFEKKAINLTTLENDASEKEKYQEFRKKLTGKIEYEAPNNRMMRFNGIIKLKKDPKAENITIANVILRGSILRNTEWVFGICVYVGNDTKIMQNTLYSKEKRSYYEKTIQKFFLCMICIVLLMSLISTVILIAYKTDDPVSLKYENLIKDGLRIFFYLILYSPTVPISVYGTLDLIFLIQRWRLEQIFQKLNSNTSTPHTKTTATTSNPEPKTIKVLDPNIFANLGQVEYCFLDKTGTLTTSNFKIKQIYMNKNIYSLEEDTIQSLIEKNYPAYTTKKITPSQRMKHIAHAISLPEHIINVPTNEVDNHIVADENIDRINIHKLSVQDSAVGYKFKDELDMGNKTNRDLETNALITPFNKDLDLGYMLHPTEEVNLLNKVISPGISSGIDGISNSGGLGIGIGGSGNGNGGGRLNNGLSNSQILKSMRQSSKSKRYTKISSGGGGGEFPSSYSKFPLGLELHKEEELKGLINEIHTPGSGNVSRDDGDGGNILSFGGAGKAGGVGKAGGASGVGGTTGSPSAIGRASRTGRVGRAITGLGGASSGIGTGRASGVITGLDGSGGTSNVITGLDGGVGGVHHAVSGLGDLNIDQLNSGLDQSIIDNKRQDICEYIQDEKEFLYDYIDKENILMNEIMTNFTICHNACTGNNNEGRIESTSPEEIAILRFAKICGKSFDMANRFDNPSLYTIRNKNETRLVKILGVNDFSYPRRRSSIVYKHSDSKGDKAIMWVKGPDYSIRDRLVFHNETEAENFDKIVEKFRIEGLKVWVFAKRVLTQTEENEYSIRYQNLKNGLSRGVKELNKLADDIEKKLELMTIIGMKDELRPGAYECIQCLKESNIKCWILTGDNYDNALNAAYNLKIVDPSKKLYILAGQNEADITVELRNILSEIKRFIDEKYNVEVDGSSHHRLSLHIKESNDRCRSNFKHSSTLKTILPERAKDVLNNSLIISGETLEIILRDMYLKTNLAFICSMCKSVVGYRLSPSNKRQFVKLVKKELINRPITLAIGDGLNDALMFQTADISIEIEKENELLPSNAADIKIHNFEVIKELLLIHGRNFANKTENIILYLFYKSFTLGFPLFFFNWYVSFTGTTIQDSMFIFLHSFLFTFFPIVIYGGFDKSEPEDVLRALPALYIDGKLSKMRIFKSFLIRSILEGCIHSAICFYLSIFCINDSLSPQGHNSDYGMASLLTVYSIIVITNLKIIWIFKRYTIICLCLICLSIAFVVIYIPINQHASFIAADYTIQTYNIFNWPGSIITLVFIILTCYGASYLIAKIIMTKFFPTLFDHFIFEAEALQSVKNSDLLKSTCGEFDFSNVVKVIYKYPEYMDPIVEEMLSPADENINALGMNKFTLKFFDKLMEKHFSELIAKDSIKYSRIACYVGLIVFGGYALGEFLINQDSTYGYSRLGIFIGFLLVSILLFTNLFSLYYERIMLFIIFLVIGAKIAFDWSSNYDSALMTGLMPMITSTVFNISSLWIFVLNTVQYVVSIARLIVLYGQRLEQPYLDVKMNSVLYNMYIIIGYILMIGGIFILSNLLGHKYEKDKRNEHAANAKLEVQLSKSNDILSILLPKFVKDKLDVMGGKMELAEDQGEVTVLFCDILDFDKIIKSENVRIVSILDYIFRKFDELCTNYGVQKIETVGKTYMACSGLKSCEIGISKDILSVDPTKRIINMGFAMLNVIKHINYNNGTKIEIKIGVNYGRVIAGVIGYHKPQFSLIGDTVNTASRICSTGKNSKINISESAFNRLKENDFIFIKHMVDAKGLGAIPNYVVEKKKSSITPKNVEYRNRIGNNTIERSKKWISSELNFHLVSRLSAGEQMDDTSRRQLLDDDMKLSSREPVYRPIDEDMNWFNVDINLSQEKEDKISEILDNMKKYNEEYDEGDYMSSRIVLGNNNDDRNNMKEDNDLELKPNTWLLTFDKNEKKRAKYFEDELAIKNMNYFKIIVSALFGIYLIQTLILITIRTNIPGSVSILLFRSAFNLLLIILIIFHKPLSRNKVLKLTSFIILYYGIVTTLIQSYVVDVWQIQNLEILEFMLIYLIASHFSGIQFFWTLILSILILLSWLIIYGIKGILTIQNVFFFCVFLITNIIHSYIFLKHEIRFYNNLQTRESKKIELKGLVTQLLPLHCIEKYFNDPNAKLDIQDDFENVTILFADIKGFTEYSNSVTANEVVKMLSELFTRFDKICLKYLVYKLYTIGDCYVAFGFIDQTKRDYTKEAINMVRLAFSMIEIIKEVRTRINFHKLDMRIGIHTGRIIGGIIGTDVVRYDIYGPDVLIANKMESNGVEGRVNISEDTKHILEKSRPDYYIFEPHVVVKSDTLGIKKQSYLLSIRNQS